MGGSQDKQAGKNSKIFNKVLGLSLRIDSVINIPEVMQIQVDEQNHHGKAQCANHHLTIYEQQQTSSNLK
jgi:hypothetical protein